MKETVILEWTFTPPDYFEEPVRIVRDNYEMAIDKGKVKTSIDAQYFDSEPGFRSKLHESVESRFLGAQILNQKPFELSESSMSRFHPDGRISRYLFAEPGKYTITGMNADLIVTGPSGIAIGDSRKEKIERRKAFAELVEKHRANNPLLQGILESHSSSIRRPENELVYLYDIRDALSKEFGGKEATCRVLNISDKPWGRFGQLANEEPLKQGRHRGRNLEILRDATEDELRIS